MIAAHGGELTGLDLCGVAARLWFPTAPLFPVRVKVFVRQMVQCSVRRSWLAAQGAGPSVSTNKKSTNLRFRMRAPSLPPIFTFAPT